MDAVSAYSFTSCAWHTLQALPLVIWPTAIAELLKIDNDLSSPQGGAAAVRSPVENYFARSLGLALVTLGLMTVVLTGSVPLDSLSSCLRPASLTPQSEKASSDSNQTPYAPPIILLTTIHHGSMAFYCWSRYNNTSQTGFVLGFLGSSVMTAFGIWCLLFGGAKARISRRTGADKRTSGFPFRNSEAERKKGR